MKTTDIVFCDHLDRKSMKRLSQISKPETSIVIVDRVVFNSLQRTQWGQWLNRVSLFIPVQAGERLKSLESFERMLKQVERKVGKSVSRSWTVVSIGGGSVGDFAGFFASVYKRGLRLVHIPTTWLAAVDSAHGGKTALNFGKAKNQLGTFYPAQTVLIARELLFRQPMENTQSAMGEFAKMALLSGGSVKRALEPSDFSQDVESLLWATLPSAVKAKMDVVRRDPFEERGRRIILNLGHSFGHCLEAHAGVPHGLAVGAGLRFALDVSVENQIMTANQYDLIQNWLDSLKIPTQRQVIQWLKRRPLSDRNFLELLLKDKKSIGRAQQIRFIALERFGRPRVIELPAREILKVAKLRGWIS